MTLLTLKIVHRGEVRRLSVEDADLTWARACALAASRFPAAAGAGGVSALTYLDDEGDRVTVTNDAEMEEAIRTTRPGTLRLELREEHASKPDAQTATHTATNTATATQTATETKTKTETKTETNGAAGAADDAAHGELRAALAALATLLETADARHAIHRVAVRGRAAGRLKHLALRLALSGVPPHEVARAVAASAECEMLLAEVAAQPGVGPALAAVLQRLRQLAPQMTASGCDGPAWAAAVGRTMGAAMGAPAMRPAARGRGQRAGCCGAFHTRGPAGVVAQALRAAASRQRCGGGGGMPALCVRGCRVAPAASAPALSQLRREDFAPTTLAALAASEPGYRFGASCDTTGRPLGRGADARFWHAKHGGVGIDLCDAAFAARFGGAGAAERAAKTPERRVNVPPAAIASAPAADSAAVAAAAAAATRLTNGSPVRVHGLVNAPQHNGRRGVVVDFDKRRGRYLVHLATATGAALLALRAANLRPIRADVVCLVPTVRAAATKAAAAADAAEKAAAKERAVADQAAQAEAKQAAAEAKAADADAEAEAAEELYFVPDQLLFVMAQHTKEAAAAATQADAASKAAAAVATQRQTAVDAEAKEAEAKAAKEAAETTEPEADAAAAAETTELHLPAQAEVPMADSTEAEAAAATWQVLADAAAAEEAGGEGAQAAATLTLRPAAEVGVEAGATGAKAGEQRPLAEADGDEAAVAAEQALDQVGAHVETTVEALAEVQDATVAAEDPAAAQPAGTSAGTAAPVAEPAADAELSAARAGPAESEPAPAAWTQELEVLGQLGFHDEALMRALLESAGGDLRRVVQTLLGAR